MNSNEPAFPVQDASKWQAHGMTLRDYFAAKAMAAMIAQYPCQAIDNEDGGRLIDNDALTGDAYDIADAMLDARERV